MTLLKDKSLGTLKYNGWTFYAMSHSKLSNRTVYDDAGRVAKWQEVTIEVEGIIDLADTGLTGYDVTADAATALWNALSEPGGELIYTGRGFPDTYVNSAQSNVRDVNWGPKPEVTSFVPTGGQSPTVHVAWKVVTHLVSCPGALYRNHIFNLTWEVAWDHDTDGYLTMSINGGYEIPLTFATNSGAGGALNVVATADQWWHRVCPPVRVGFQRTTKNRKISKDRRRVDFSIVDKELPVPLLPDCTMIEAKQRVRNDRPMNFAMWTSTISGTVRTNPLLPRSVAWDRFAILLRARINHARRFGGNPVAVGAGGGVGGPIGDAALAILSPLGVGTAGAANPRAAGKVVMMSVDFEEDIFGRDSRFSVTYRIVGTGLDAILKRSGLWLKVPSSHELWQSTMDDAGINKPSGRRGGIFEPRHDVMIDLCGGPAARQVPQPATSNNEATPDPQSHTAELIEYEATQLFFPPDQSWLEYWTEATLVEQDHVIRHKPLKGRLRDRRPSHVANGNVLPILSETDTELLLTTWDTPDILQTVCSPDTSVVLTGKAMRLGYKPNAPRIVKFGGKDVKQVKAIVNEAQVGNMQGIPIWGLAWHIEYYLTEPTAGMATLANPLLLTNGNDRTSSGGFTTGLSR